MSKEKAQRYFLIALLDKSGANPLLEGYVGTMYPNFNTIVDKIDEDNTFNINVEDYCITNILEVTKEDYNVFWFNNPEGL